MGRIADGLAKRRNLRRAKPLERASSVTLHFLSAVERAKLGPTLFRVSDSTVPEQILLLDDIVTTGTTLRAAIKLLRGAGAKKIYLAAVARQAKEF
jgi:predicted amidophosphoribosyltransferase